jgi:hypothetical protein
LDKVNFGISANLCDALAGLLGRTAGAVTVEVNVDWSPFRRVPSELRSTARFEADSASIFAEAARLLKETAPVQKADFRLLGTVTKLDREPSAGGGEVTVRPEGLNWRVKLWLPEPEYRIAVNAHERKQRVTCIGTLRREGRRTWLDDPIDFQVVP